MKWLLVTTLLFGGCSNFQKDRYGGTDCALVVEGSITKLEHRCSQVIDLQEAGEEAAKGIKLPKKN